LGQIYLFARYFCPHFLGEKMRPALLLFTILSSFIHCENKKKTDFTPALIPLMTNNSISQKYPQYGSLANSVFSAPANTGSGFKNAQLAINGVRGGGCCGGSLDVFTLDSSGEGSVIVLEWLGKRVKNGQGIDFVVFENPFQNGTNPNSLFMEQSFVEVGIDGKNFCGFSPKYTAPNPLEYSNNPEHWVRFAGIKPVLFHEENNRLEEKSLFDPNLAGGDGFDLEHLSSANDFNIGCSEALRAEILTEGFIYLRLVNIGARVNPETSQGYPRDPGSFDGGADIDGVAGRYLENR
jgi:hypothetical protein